MEEKDLAQLNWYPVIKFKKGKQFQKTMSVFLIIITIWVWIMFIRVLLTNNEHIWLFLTLSIVFTCVLVSFTIYFNLGYDFPISVSFDSTNIYLKYKPKRIKTISNNDIIDVIYAKSNIEGYVIRKKYHSSFIDYPLDMKSGKIVFEWYHRAKSE